MSNGEERAWGISGEDQMRWNTVLGDTIRMGSDTWVRTRTCSVLIATGLRCGSVGWGAAYCI